MQLPQKHDWQVTLRNWIAERVSDDFNCGLNGLTYHESYFENDDDVYRAWVTFEDLGRDIALINGIRIDPCSYTLEKIEAEDGIRMKTYVKAEPASMAWLTTWNYAGNPYSGSDRLGNRALVSAMVDMIMSWEELVEGKTDEQLSGSCQLAAGGFATWAYVYHTLRHQLTIEVQVAFEDALGDYVLLFHNHGPTGIHADLDLPAIIGMHYASLYLGPWAESHFSDYIDTFLDNHYNSAGYIDHVGGYEGSYGGVGIKYLSWAAHATGDQRLIKALRGVSKLKAHLTYQDEDGSFTGPSGMNSRTSDSTASDQRWSYGRDVGVVYLCDEARYLLHTGRNVEPWYAPYGVQGVATMKAQLASWTSRANNQEANERFGTWTRESEDTPLPWSYSLHQAIPSVAWDYYPEGFYAGLSLAQGYNLPHLGDDFIEQHGDAFTTFRKGKLYGALHTGPLSWHDDPVKLSGLSGGSLVALGADGMGMCILSRAGGFQSGNEADWDTWDNMEQWGVNHLWGSLSGEKKSSATRNPDPRVIISDDEAMVAAFAKPENPLLSTRTFSIKPEELRINSRILDIPGLLGLEDLGWEELWETLPFVINEDARVCLWVDGEWATYKEGEAMQADRIAYMRGGQGIIIELDEVRLVKLGTIRAMGYQQERVDVLPVHIDVLVSGAIHYKISGPYAIRLEPLS